MEYKNGGFGISAPTNGNADDWIISGFASTFGNIDQQGDKVLPGAYAETIITRPELPLLWQHQTDNPIGKVFLMAENDKGLFFKAVIADTRQGSDAQKLVSMGAVSGVSIGYDPTGATPTRYGRDLSIIDLWEISVVTFPANEAAGITGYSGKMRDLLIMAEYDALQSKGRPIPDSLALAAINAMQRQAERAQYNGLTWEQERHRMLSEIQKLRCQSFSS